MTTQLEIHRELYEKLVDLLQQNKSNDVNRLQNTLKSLEKEYHNSIYSHLVYILSHLFFKEKEAKEHWKNILHIRDEMIKKLGYEIDFRVAMLSYFIDIKKDIESPMVIEIMLFKKTQEEAYIDQLTGLYNYRYFMNQLVEEFKKAKRYEMPLSLVMFDLDNFKIYNDFYGHLKGNLVLHQISKILVHSIRDVDLVSRFGGEEFALILPNTTKNGAYIVAERIRKSVEQRAFRIKNKVISKKITISAGIATYRVDAENSQKLLERADEALYLAKNRGKNTITLYSPERREHQRFAVNITGKYAQLTTDYTQFQTVNISKRGLLFRTKQDIPVCSIIGIILTVPLGNNLEKEIKFTGKAIRIKKQDDFNEISIKIIYINRKDNSDLANYLNILESKAK